MVPGCARTWASGPQHVASARRPAMVAGAEPAAVPGVPGGGGVAGLPILCGGRLPAPTPTPRGALLRSSPESGCASRRVATRGWMSNFGGRPNRRSTSVVRFSLRGLAPQVVAQVLFGLQQRCRREGVRTNEGDLRPVCNDLRRQQVSSVTDYRLQAGRSLAFAVHRQTGWSAMFVEHWPADVRGPPDRRGRRGKKARATKAGSAAAAGIRSLRHRLVHRHHSGVAATGHETLGRRRPAAATDPAGATHQRRAQRAPPRERPLALLSASLRVRPDGGEVSPRSTGWTSRHSSTG